MINKEVKGFKSFTQSNSTLLVWIEVNVLVIIVTVLMVKTGIVSFIDTFYQDQILTFLVLMYASRLAGSLICYFIPLGTIIWLKNAGFLWSKQDSEPSKDKTSWLVPIVIVGAAVPILMEIMIRLITFARPLYLLLMEIMIRLITFARPLYLL